MMNQDASNPVPGSSATSGDANVLAVAALVAMCIGWASRRDAELMSVARVGLEAIRKVIPGATSLDLVEALMEALARPTPPTNGNGKTHDASDFATNVIALLKKAA